MKMKITNYIINKLCTKMTVLVVLSMLAMTGSAWAQKMENSEPRGICGGATCAELQKCILCTMKRADAISSTTTKSYSCILKTEKASDEGSILTGKYCSDAPNGGENTTTNTFIFSKPIVIKNADTNACDKSCAPYCYMAENKVCLFCDLFKVAFNASSKIAGVSMAALAAPVVGIISVAMAIWLAVTILAFVSAPEVRDTKDLAVAIFNQSFIFAIVFILLQTGGSSFYNLALEPIFNTGMVIAEKTVAPTDGVGGCEGVGGYGIISPAEGGGLPQSMGNSIICTMTAIQDRVARVRAVGSAAMCQSWKDKAFIIPHLGYLLTGLGLWIGGTILLLALPFLMLDSILQLAVAAALLPAAIGCYTFKVTRGYVKKVWETFLNCMFVFIFLSIVILILATAFEHIIVDSNVGKSFDKILNEGTSVNMKDILDNISWFSVPFLKIVFVLVLTWTVMGEMLGFASQFAGSISSGKIGSSIGAMGASAAKGIAKTTLGKPAEAIKDEAWDQTKRAGRGLVHGARRAALNRQSNKVMKRAQEQGGVNADGSFTAKSKTWRGREVESKVVVNADGTRTLTAVKTISENKRVVTQKDAYFTVKSVESNLGKDGKVQRDEKGNVVYKQTSQTVRINNDAVNKLINKDGTYNAEKMQEIINNSSLPKDTVKSLIANEIISKRMPNMGFDARNHNMGKQTVTENADGSFVVSSQNAKGQKIDIKIAFGANDRLKSDITTTDAKGRGKKLSSDGIINHRQTFALDENGNIEADSVNDSYGYTSYYQSYHNQKRYNKIPLGESMYSEEEVKQAGVSAEQIRRQKKQAMSEFGD